MITRSGSARWKGGIRDGHGTVSTESGALSDRRYSFGTRFEDEAGTNPEELIGAAHAACFSMALSLILGEAGVRDVTIDTSSAVSVEKLAGGFEVTKVHLRVHVNGTGDEAVIREAAKQAETGCPISKLMKAPISMDLTVN